MTLSERGPLIAATFGCGPNATQALASICLSQSFRHGVRLAQCGDVSRYCRLVINGAAQSQLVGSDGQRVQLALYGPGQIFGAYPLPAAHRSDIVAKGDLQLFSFDCVRLASLAAGHAEIGAGLAKLIAKELDLVLDRMASRVTLTATGRVCAELLRLAGDSTTIAPSPIVAALALSVHTTRETASRTLTQLERRGIIHRHGNALTIVSRRVLEALVC